MKQLLTIEFLKLRKLKSLRVIFLLYFLVIPFLIYTISWFLGNYMEMLLPKGWSALQFPNVWAMSVYGASYFNILMGVLAVVIIGNEFTYKTFRQHVIDGLSLQQAILSKFLVILIFSLVITAYTFVTGLLFGLYNTTDGTLFTEGLSNIGFYFLQTLCYFSLAFLITVLLKKTAVSITLFVVAFIAETIIGVLLALAKLQIVYAFFPLNAFSRLTPFPILKEMIAAGQERNGNTPYLLSTPVELTICITYMVVFFLLAYWILKKRDL